MSREFQEENTGAEEEQTEAEVTWFALSGCWGQLALAAFVAPTAVCLCACLPWSSAGKPLSLTAYILVYPWARRIACASLAFTGVSWLTVAAWRHVAVLASLQPSDAAEAKQGCICSWLAVPVAFLCAWSCISTGAFDPVYSQAIHSVLLVMTGVSACTYCFLQTRIDRLWRDAGLSPRRSHCLLELVRRGLTWILAIGVLGMAGSLFVVGLESFDRRSFAIFEWATAAAWMAYASSWWFGPQRTYAIHILLAVPRLNSTAAGGEPYEAEPETPPIVQASAAQRVESLFVIPMKVLKVMWFTVSVHPFIFLVVCYGLAIADGRITWRDTLLSSSIDVGLEHRIGSIGMTIWGAGSFYNSLLVVLNVNALAAQRLPSSKRLGCWLTFTALLTCVFMTLVGSFEKSHWVHRATGGPAFLFGILNTLDVYRLYRSVEPNLEGVPRCVRLIKGVFSTGLIVCICIMGYFFVKASRAKLGIAELVAVMCLGGYELLSYLSPAWCQEDHLWHDIRVSARLPADDTQLEYGSDDQASIIGKVSWPQPTPKKAT